MNFITALATQLAAEDVSSAEAAMLLQEIEHAYRGPDRHYHNLHHLDRLLEALEPVEAHIEDWPVVLFAIAWHDVVYDPLRKDNEEASAALAGERLRAIGLPAGRISRCREHILATKGHTIASDPDTNYFTDADLSVLGAAAAAYDRYARGVRAEYAVYPDALYNPGRKAVLQHFLEMERIFKTAYFAQRYEAAARNNIARELHTL